MSASASADASSVHSHGAKSVNSKRRWRDLGLTGGAAGASLSNMMRNARKSTDSLRSAASHRSRSKRNAGDVDASGSSSRPASVHSSIYKDLPGLPNVAADAKDNITEGRRSSSVSSGVIHNVPEDAPLEFYEMPDESDGITGDTAQTQATGAETDGQHPRDVKTPTLETSHDSRRDTITYDSLRGNGKSMIERKGSIVQGAQPVQVATRSTSLSNSQTEPTSYNADPSYEGWTAMQENDRGSGTRTPTNDDTAAHLSSQQQNNVGASAKALARKSFSRLRRKSTVTDEGRPSAASAATKVTQSSSADVAAPEVMPSAFRRSAQTETDTQWASDKVGGGDGNTIAQLYAVFGLPKDPTVWTLAEDDCVAGVHHVDGAIKRFWRPEVLGCSICPSPAELTSGIKPSDSGLSSTYDGDKANGRKNSSDGKKASSPKFIEMSDGRGGTEKTETARVLSKALKLSFTREVEIVAEQGHYPPKASSHTFSFSVPTLASGDAHERTGANDGRKAAMATGVSVSMAHAAKGVGEGYGLTSQRRNGGAGLSGDGQDGPRLATFYGVALTVWSAADEKRAKVIRKELARAAKARGGQMTSSKSASSNLNNDATNGATSNGAWPDGNNDDLGLSAIASSPDTVFFMPYAICIVSRFPLYNLLGDWNKMAWHKYSRNIEMHNQLMSTILRHPAPRLGEEVSVGSPDKDVSFHCTFPGAVEWGTGLTGIDFAMWPLFSALSADHILTICEVALGHNGRVLFVSRHPALLGMAVETVHYLVEQCGWRGIAHQNCHARDVRIYLEDPGSWIIGINTELRGLVQPPKEVCMVDLDLNRVECGNPPLNAVSKGQQREKRRRRIMQAVFVSNFECTPPREFVDAYPGGRLRPLSRMHTRDINSAYEQLPEPRWWNQAATLQAFDAALREDQRKSFLKKLLSGGSAGKGRSSRTTVATQAELAAILALRKRASTFVDARDGLENKIGRLNKRLAFLMSESEMWRAQFSKIQILVDRLTKEANDLRGKVDKERRESKRLSSRLAERDIEQVQLQLQLKETEGAREEAIQELLRMKTAMESVEQEREAMMDEIRTVLAGGGNIDDVNLSVSRLDLPTFNNPLSRSSSPTGSQASMTPSQAAEYVLKARALAEARISEGRPGRERSRAASRTSSAQGHMRSLSQDRGERNRKGSFSASTSQANHYPDEQMNYEIQQRTSMVTSQISRIQQQLESTLTNLEGRRSGTYERESERRRMRRSSNASINSTSRYEYRGSSVGHGGADSVDGHASDDGRTDDLNNYERMESVKDQQTRGGESRRRRERKNAAPPTASSQSLREAYAAGAASSASSVYNNKRDSLPLPPSIGPKSLARRSDTNEWKTLPPPMSPTDSVTKANTVFGTPASEPESPWAEVVNAHPIDASASSPHEASGDIANGVASQPLLSALQPKQEKDTHDQDIIAAAPSSAKALSQSPSSSTHTGGGSGSAKLPASSSSGEWQAQRPGQAVHDANTSGGTSPTLANISNGPESEIMISQSGWVLENKNINKEAVATKAALKQAPIEAVNVEGMTTEGQNGRMSGETTS